MKKMTHTGETAIKVGAGLVAAGAAAAAGYYFYGSKNAKHHRKIAIKWAADMKSEVLKEVKHLEKVSPEMFATIVDRVAKSYQTGSVDPADIHRAVKELKANWAMVKKEAKTTGSRVKKAK